MHRTADDYFFRLTCSGSRFNDFPVSARLYSLATDCGTPTFLANCGLWAAAAIILACAWLLLGIFQRPLLLTIGIPRRVHAAHTLGPGGVAFLLQPGDIGFLLFGQHGLPPLLALVRHADEVAHLALGRGFTAGVALPEVGIEITRIL